MTPLPAPLASPAAGPVAPVGPAGRGPGRKTAAPSRPPTDPRSVAHALAAVWLEVECGRRSRRQLRPLVSAQLDARLAGVTVEPGQPGHLLQTHGTAVSACRYEAVALVQRGARVTALGLSLVRQGKTWRLDDVVRPECGPLPRPAFAVPPDSEDDLAAAEPLRGGITPNRSAPHGPPGR